MEDTMLVLDSYEANYAVTISDVNTKRVIGVLYFNVPYGNSTASIFNVLANYDEYCQPNFRIDISKVRNGRRVFSKNF